ncbi:hypothetical protein [[Flexibacter] sp. ATCC 35208]|uniref:hypothetical protein n=1 Tax=[Flexibacter] sp. ATCC 35208 TaxID=1936242 RepID=UPI0009D0D8E5|nr:hypothetical protein [[Flexibacter] sp. ATCC 35208]OMP74908.1 hypothetical protein BW716_32980 [[Flexibacter] sp. ATCC 35208]
MNVLEFFIQQKNIVNKYLLPQGKEWIYEIYLPRERKQIPFETSNLLYDLFEYLDMSKVGAFDLCFSNVITETDDFFKIGFRDSDSICIDKVTGEVKFISEDDIILYSLAGSLSEYLEIYGVLSNYDIRGFLGHIYSQEDRDIVLSQCKRVLINPQYFKFYESSFKLQ